MNLEGKTATVSGFFNGGNFIPCAIGCTGMAVTGPQPEMDLAFSLRFTYTLDQLEQFKTDLAKLRSDPKLADVRWVQPRLMKTGISDPEKYQQLVDQASELKRQLKIQVQEFLDKTGIVCTGFSDGSNLTDYLQYPIMDNIRSQIADLRVDEPRSGEIVIFFGKDHPEYSITIPA